MLGGPNTRALRVGQRLEAGQRAPLVEGWPGIDAIKRVGVGALGSKILCKSHNEALSPLDAAASNLFGAVQQFDGDLADAARPVVASEVEVDGALIERWLLKVLLGVAAVHTRAGDEKRTRDHDRCMSILFGLEAWPDRWGFYLPAGLGDQYVAPADVAVQTRVNPADGELWGLTAWARFLPLILCLGTPDGMDLRYRPGAIQMGRSGSQEVKTLVLNWNDASAHETVGFTRTGSADAWGDLPT